MGKQYSELTIKNIQFIEEQKVFFVGTAADEGKVNISPKGGDSLRVVNANQVIWQNLTGSGNETAAHVRKMPRMTIMFCSFEGAPLILRLYGSAKAIHRTDSEWDKCIELFPENVATRQFFLLDIDMVQSSCGMSVPFFSYERDREELNKHHERQGKEKIEQYWVKKNQLSLDNFETGIVELNGVGDSNK